MYVGLNGGNYRPATADETWKRRFGDCKAKTALLLALLRTLEVPAEATLVNAEDGDGIDDRLPSPSVFNHVLVRATLGEKSYWLDGTLRGNLSLANLPPQRFRWALPLRAKDATLVAVPLEAPVEPQLIDVVDIDATAGIERPARIKVQRVVRGAEVPEYRANLSNLPLDGVDRVLKTYWRESGGWVLENQSVAWRYDEGHEALILSMTGEGKPDWETTSDDTPRLALPGAGFTPPSELKRPKEQDQAAPWTTEFPIFHCWATTVRLPDPGASAWSYRSAPVDRKLGGIAYWRTAALRGNVMRTVMSKRFYLPEISAAEAAEVNAAIPGFDNKKSIVYQTPATQVRTPPSAAPMPPFGDETNWLESSALCSSPKRPSL